MTFPNDETGQVLAEMHDAGVDLTIMHAVVFFNLFEQKSQAQAMQVHLQAQAPDMQVELCEDEMPNVWDINCTVNMVPSYDGIIAQEAEFEQLSAKFKGYNDGWGIQA